MTKWTRKRLDFIKNYSDDDLEELYTYINTKRLSRKADKDYEETSLGYLLLGMYVVAVLLFIIAVLF